LNALVVEYGNVTQAIEARRRVREFVENDEACVCILEQVLCDVMA
jgi:hypothetical protein